MFNIFHFIVIRVTKRPYGVLFLEFKVQKEESPTKGRYSKDQLDIAYRFSELAYKEFGHFIKAIVLFGSITRKEKLGGDIDVLVIVNDLGIAPRPEVVETYRIIMQNLIAQVSPKLHITTLKLTNFWEFVKAGDPVAINMLRDGFAIIDTGFFEPLQALLRWGRIRPTPESVWSYFVRAPATLYNSKWHIIQAVLDLYWAVIDSAHSALMRLNVIPTSPEHVADLLEEKMVKTNILSAKYPKIMRKFYILSKQITHRELKELSGKEYDELYKEAEDFVSEMKKTVESVKDYHPQER